MNGSFKRNFGTSFKYFGSLNSFKYKINKINHFHLKGNPFENKFFKKEKWFTFRNWNFRM
jgi:hypothetical protein